MYSKLYSIYCVNIFTDCGSMMHYNEYAFSSNGQKTIESLDPLCVIGRNFDHPLSIMDKVCIKALYWDESDECTNMTWRTTTPAPVKNNSVFNQRNLLRTTIIVSSIAAGFGLLLFIKGKISKSNEEEFSPYIDREYSQKKRKKKRKKKKQEQWEWDSDNDHENEKKKSKKNKKKKKKVKQQKNQNSEQEYVIDVMPPVKKKVKKKQRDSYAEPGYISDNRRQSAKPIAKKKKRRNKRRDYEDEYNNSDEEGYVRKDRYRQRQTSQKRQKSRERNRSRRRNGSRGRKDNHRK